MDTLHIVDASITDERSLFAPPSASPSASLFAGGRRSPELPPPDSLVGARLALPQRPRGSITERV